jgi:hypothetical protein
MGSLSPASWALILGVSCIVLVALMIFILVAHKVSASNERFHARKKELIERLNRTDLKEEELNSIKQELCDLKQESLLSDTSSLFEGVVNSPSARSLDSLLWHNAVGRLTAHHVKSMFLRIDTVLNTALAFFINSLAGVIIQFYYVGENLITGWTIAVLILLVLMTFFGLVSYHVVHYIDTRLVNPGLYNEKDS